jgi:CheY-like chemotaxis protein
VKRCGARILIVDDNADLSELLAFALANVGYKPQLAGNGIEALAVLQLDPKPDLILLDVRMPRMNGFQFRAAQESDPSIGSIPVVVLCTNALFADEATMLRAAAYVGKPLDIERLLDVVSQHCGPRVRDAVAD